MARTLHLTNTHRQWLEGGLRLASGRLAAGLERPERSGAQLEQMRQALEALARGFEQESNTFTFDAPALEYLRAALEVQTYAHEARLEEIASTTDPRALAMVEEIRLEQRELLLKQLKQVDPTRLLKLWGYDERRTD